MAFAAMIVCVLLAVPGLTALLAWLENRRSGEWLLQRTLLGGRLLPGLLRSFLNSVWTLWLTVLALPLGRLLGYRCEGARGDRPPVLLVHGLYHNPAAWFVLRRRLARAGYADVRCYGYASFFRSFEDIADGVARQVLEAGTESASGQVLLIGHSLGGLVIRAACADPRTHGRVAGVATLVTPHRGSTLAGMLGLGGLARGLAPGGQVIRQVRALAPARCPALSLHTPTDCMVLPFSGALLDERERQCGWTERALPAMSHVGLLYSRAAAGELLAFLDRVCGQGPGRDERG